MVRKKQLSALLIVIILLIGFPIIFVIHEIRHITLNRMLIEAIEAEQYKEALLLLKLGADGTARRSDSANTGLKATLSRLMDLIRHRRRVSADQVYDDCALAILYAPNGYDVRRTDPEYQQHHPEVQRLALGLLEAGSPTDFWAVESMPDLVLLFHHHNVLNRLLQMHPGVIKRCSLEFADLVDSATLLAHGADPNQNYPDRTPAYSASSAKLKLLLAFGAKVNVADDYHNTPLLSARERGDEAAVSLLLEHGASVRVVNDDGYNPVTLAAAHCSLETVMKLSFRGSDLRKRATSGDTAFIRSMYNSDERVFRWLLAKGVDLNLRGHEGKTPLIAAAECGSLVAIKTLLKRGADASVKEDDGMTALKLARKNRFGEVVRALAAAGVAQ
jgi:hypothetical protein